jgi:high-affinity Fe2+/Pb2+ permease
VFAAPILVRSWLVAFGSVPTSLGVLFISAVFVAMLTMFSMFVAVLVVLGCVIGFLLAGAESEGERGQKEKKVFQGHRFLLCVLKLWFGHDEQACTQNSHQPLLPISSKMHSRRIKAGA